MENDPEWIRGLRKEIVHPMLLVEDWDKAPYPPGSWGVVFVDQNPIESRVDSVLHLKDRTDIFVVHGADEPGCKIERLDGLFKYRVDFKGLRLNTSMFSNSSDVGKLARSLTGECV
jgi:hypothetical protein